MALLITYFSLAVIISFICSLLESVILSISSAYIAVRIKEKKKSAFILSKLKKEINRPLAAILTLNTFANMVGAAGVGAQALKIWGNEAVALLSTILTFVILIFSEIIPKTLGATHWKKLAPYSAYTIHWLIFLTFPFVFLAEKIAYFLTRGHQKQMTRDEMIETAEIGASEGTLRQKESSVIKNLLMLDKIYVSDIMTPRSVIFALRADATVGETFEENRPIRYSRIPVFEDNLDRMLGMIHRYKILEAISHDQHERRLSEFLTPVETIHQSMTISSVLDVFIKKKQHMFVVLDDHESVVGIVTLEDAIETLLGVEIVDEFDSVADLRAYALEKVKSRRLKKS